MLRAIEALTTPLLPSDYLELINPLWSTRELRGRIERIEPETGDAATVVIKPGYRWDGHRPGQYLRIGVDIKGRRHWRAYSLTSEPGRADGCISITVKHVDEGVVSPYLVKHGRVGRDRLPRRRRGRLRAARGAAGEAAVHQRRQRHHADHEHAALDRARRDVVLLHSARTPDDVIFGDELRALDGVRLHEQHTGEHGRMTPEHLDELCPDWRERETFASGPGELLDALEAHWEAHGDPDRFHLERFQPKLLEAEGDGGTIVFLKSDCEVETDGTKPILVAGEEAGLELPYGCREGICHTCVGTLRSGRLRDLRNGKVVGNDGETVRTCINAPEGRVEIEL